MRFLNLFSVQHRAIFRLLNLVSFLLQQGAFLDLLLPWGAADEQDLLRSWVGDLQDLRSLDERDIRLVHETHESSLLDVEFFSLRTDERFSHWCNLIMIKFYDVANTNVSLDLIESLLSFNFATDSLF